MCGPPTEYVDPQKAEIAELRAYVDEQEQEIAALRYELSNTKYISHRRWELLQERKRQQSEVEAERDALRAQLEDIRAVVDALEEFAKTGEVSSGIAVGWRQGVEIAVHNLRAALSLSEPEGED